MPHGGYHGTVKMGGNVIQQGGTGKDAGKLAPKDDKGQFIPFDTPLVNMPTVPTGQSTGPAGQTRPADILQNIVDQKNILKFQTSPDRPGMNAYQDAIQNFRTSSDANMAAYADRFPLTQFAMTGLPRIAMSMLPGGNVFSTIANAYQSGKGRVQGGLSTIADEFNPMVQGIKSLFIKDKSTPEEFVVRKNQSAPLGDRFDETNEKKLNTSVDTDNEDIFKLPYDQIGSYATATNINPNIIRETEGNYLVNNPTFGLQMIKRADGGLASLSNQDYNMLMNASNFGF